MIQEITRIDLKGVNCYLGREDKNYILFDTGGHMFIDKTYTDRSEALISELDKAGCKPGNLKLVVLTHGDIDHIANAVLVRERYQTKIAMHAGDLPLVESVTVEKMMENFKFQSVLLKMMAMVIKNKISKISKKILGDFKTFSPDICLNEGDSLSGYGFDAIVIHLPGHTKGSIGILIKNGDLIAGDIFFSSKKPGVAPNAVNFKTLAESIARLKGMNINTIYPGHGQPFEMNKLK